jgi:hypothetical protein
MSQAPKAFYKLLVLLKLDPQTILTQDEFKVQLFLKNIGDAVFPGGEITRFSVKYPSGGMQEIQRTRLQKIQKIEPNEILELEPRSFNAFEEGSMWISLSIKPIDEGEMHLFQTVEYDMGQTWQGLFIVRKREFVEMINLLEKIVKLLEKKGN